jgi:hypothetical protein
MENKAKIESELQNALPALAELINQELGFTPELNLQSTSYGFSIESIDLLSELGNTLAKTMFTSIKIRMTSDCMVINNSIWFNPKLKYEHPKGGSNGTDFIWQHLGFNLDEQKWITGKKII